MDLLPAGIWVVIILFLLLLFCFFISETVHIGALWLCHTLLCMFDFDVELHCVYALAILCRLKCNAVITKEIKT